MEFTTITRRVAEICGRRRHRDRARSALSSAPAGWRGRDGRSRAGRARATRPAPGGRSGAGARSAPMASDAGAISSRPRARARRKRAGRRRAPTGPCATLDELKPGSPARTRPALVAFDTETTSLDPLQADLVGVSLAVAPGEACYVPIGHRAGRGRSVRAAAGSRRARSAEADALALLKPLLEGAGRAQDRPERQVRLCRCSRSAASTSRRSTTRC